MKKIKEVSEISGVSIRTLRYYDQTGLLQPSCITEAGYRLYDETALEKLQQILFWKELELPLVDIKKIMETPNYDRKQALLTQKALLEHKRNRLNGIIELIDDVMEGVNTMNFEAFNDEDVNKILDHSLALQSEASLKAIAQKFGSVEAFREFVGENLKDEKTGAQLIQLYGSKDKAVEASLHATGNQEALQNQQQENDAIYRQFAQAMETGNPVLASNAVEKLAENYKAMFRLDNARYLLLEVANDYLSHSPVAEATDQQYGAGIAQFIAQAIRQYYGG